MKKLLVAGALLCLIGQWHADAALIVEGNDYIYNSTGQVALTIFDPFFPGGFTETIALNQTTDPCIIHRDAQAGTTIDTEIVDLAFDGASMNLGPMTIRVGTAQGVVAGGSFGQITNVVQNPLDPGYATGDPSSFQSGDSFFDVFFEIDIGAMPGQIFYSGSSHPMFSPIDAIPPSDGTEYIAPGPVVVGIWTDNGTPGVLSDDVQVGTATDMIHGIPEPSTLAFIGLAGGIALFIRRFRLY